MSEVTLPLPVGSSRQQPAWLPCGHQWALGRRAGLAPPPRVLPTLFCGLPPPGAPCPSAHLPGRPYL